MNYQTQQLTQSVTTLATMCMVAKMVTPFMLQTSQPSVEDWKSWLVKKLDIWEDYVIQRRLDVSKRRVGLQDTSEGRVVYASTTGELEGLDVAQKIIDSIRRDL